MRRTALTRSFVLAAALGSLVAASALADLIYADDAIVQGSLCVGLDCVNGEVFAADVFRLKENNTRIKFEDTSDPLLAPSTDWGVTANDSASGGLSRFSIDDVTDATTPFWIDGGAPSGSLYVTSAGDVGIGTEAPAAKLHVAGSVRIDGDLILTGGARAGRIPASAFAADRTASVTFATPYTRDYAVALTPVASGDKGHVEAWLTAKDANGFSFAVKGKPSRYLEVAWTTRWVGEF
jgi:hypothetical protein